MKSFYAHFRVGNVHAHARMQSRIFYLFLLIGTVLQGQTLVDPAGDGGFNNGMTFGENGWFTYSSLSATNKWSCGGAGQPPGFGNRSAFISKNDGATWAYDSSTFIPNVSHLYRFVSFPAGQNGFTLEFDWQSNGEANWDYLLVSLAPEGNTGLDPVETLYSNINDSGGDNDKLKPPAIHLGKFGPANSKQHAVIQIPQLMIGNCDQNVVKKLVFTWVNDIAIGAQKPALVDNVSLVVNNDLVSELTISHPPDVCETGTDPTWIASPTTNFLLGTKGHFSILSGTPANALVDVGGGGAKLNLGKANPGQYVIQYIYETKEGCVYTIKDTIEVFETPKANLKKTVVNCIEAGSLLDLKVMFQGANTEGGIFTMTESGMPVTVDSIFFKVPPGGGCFEVTYTVLDPHNCVPGLSVSNSNFLLLTTKPQPSLSFDQPHFICNAGGSVPIVVDRTSTGDNPDLRVNGNLIMPGTFTLLGPATKGFNSYEFCLIERNNQPAACGGSPNLVGLCYDSICERIIVYNDGNGCGVNAPFISECFPDLDLTDPCPTDTRANLSISCGVITIPTYDVIQAKLEADDALIFCDEESATVSFRGSLPGFAGELVAGGQTFRELGGPASEIVCDILTFTIPLGPFGEIDPLPLGPYEKICDQTVGQFIFSYLGDLIGGGDSGDGGGGFVVADTDGDGAFDIVLKDYTFPSLGTVEVPNHIRTAKGTITVRNVVAWPDKPHSPCGVVVPDGINLLDLVPLGTFPILGAMGEDILNAASCDAPLDFSDEKTVEIPVINTTPPLFANCNPDGYAFSEDLACNTSANWSVPLAYDGCNGDLLNFKGHTGSVLSTYFVGTPSAPVTVTASGVYQTAGPLPGSDLPAGTYTVTYTAYSCGGITSTCSFPVKVSPGIPVLACHFDLTVKTDADECRAVVTGLTPLQGLGCATIINVQIDYPAASGIPQLILSSAYSQANLGTHWDASGQVFPIGSSFVRYTMLVDINGDGDVLDPNETQTCSFRVTVVDGQKPVAACKDVEVQLNNTGTATVYAVNQGNGSVFVNGGSLDNCDVNPAIQIAAAGGTFSAAIAFDCDNVGSNLVNLKVTDAAGNSSICIAGVQVHDFFDGIKMDMDLPEICLEANNPVQLDFSNYLNITLPNGQVIKHNQVASNPYLGDAQGFFGISAFLPHPGSPSTDPGSIGSNGVYTPGTGTGFVTVSYVLALPGFTTPGGNAALGHCFTIAHATFELRQPLQMASPECACVMENKRIVDLGVVSGGLEPYTIHFSDGVLDFNGDGVADDFDGQYTYDQGHGYNINDFTQDLGELRIVYNPFSNWSVSIVDARGCEIFRSGSCDNADLIAGPSIPCPASNNTLTTAAYVCESQYTWTHPVPADNCGVGLFDIRIKNPDGSIYGPDNLNALLYPPPSGNPPSFLQGIYNFKLGVSIVTYYAEDGVGNTNTCSFQITVTDNDPPNFLNCPAPPVVQDAEQGHCDAYVTFALPLATDNCTIPSIVKIDNTGLNTGSRFPVGTTILYWEAKDPFNNKDTCQIKVIVNDYWQVPVLTCPANVQQNNDPWLCGAKVFNIAPSVEGPCKNNYGVTYSIYGDAALTQRKDCGVSNASGKFFDIGDSWVKYTVQNQPLLLITEVTQSGAVDRIEISNLGPAAIDISCLEIKRLSGNAAANQTIGPVTMLPSLAGIILPVGGTQVFSFSFNGTANLPACYTISYMGAIFDEVATNGFAGCNGFAGMLNGGDVIRKCEDDSNSAADWVLAENCYPLSIGAINPDLSVMAANGTKTSLQSIEPNKVSCTFKVTTKDTEKPFCGKLTNATTYNGAAIPNISTATCNRSTITIPAGTCIIGDIVFNRTGTATPANSTMTLISPKGIKTVITEIPDDSLATLFAQKAEGVWVLDVVPFPGQSPTLTGWSLTINCLANFDQADQVLPNQTGQCGAPFTWIHPFFVDNCFQGTISVAYTSGNAACVPLGGPLPGTLVKGGYQTTQFFCVGTTKVIYTLTDAAGNTEICSFLVTVNDVEQPKVVCPGQLFANLNGGECGAFVNYAPLSATDNCTVTSMVMTPPSGSWFDIGDHPVTIVISDAAGNTASCTFTVSVIEFVPSDFNLICNDLSHVSMDETCVYVVLADEVLEGDNYHCYDDYIITITNAFNQPAPNHFGPADIGKIFTIRITDPETGNSCWSNLKIEDKLVPALTCPANTTIACSEATDVSNTGNVLVADCSPYTSVIDDEFVDLGQCNSPRGQILRTWLVTDKWGNQSSCNQIITITPFDLQALVFPLDKTVDCESAYLNANTISPDITGRPSIHGFPIGVGGLCTASISYVDERFDICPGSYEILRTWKVRNTCFPVSANNPVEHVQIITVSDLNGPKFVCPPTVTVSSDPFSCCSTAALPDMVVAEGCSHIINLEAKVSGVDPNNGNIITFTVPGHLEDFPGNNWWNPDTLAVFDYTQCVPLGAYTVRYKASDECGNTTYCSFELQVADLVPPVVACDQVTQVALGNNGMALIDAAVLNDGTIDNCCLDHFEVRRMNANSCDSATFGPTVKFCCSDIGDTILVVFRAFDCHDNFNDCMVSVLVEDKIKPSCNPPAQVVVNCENFDPSLWAYGNAVVADNCCLDSSKVYLGQTGLAHSVNYSLFDTVCNKGTITRTFRSTDCAGNSSSCTQRIIVTYLQDYYVKFPNDAIVTTCDGTGLFGDPIFFGEDCELLGVSFADQIFTVVPDACFKIEREWSIINWCTFNPNLPFIEVPNPNPNAISNHATNLPGPTVSACGTLQPWKSTVVKILPTDPLPGTDYCEFWDQNANGYHYKQIIKITDGQAPTGTYVVPDCSNQNWFTPNNNALWNESYWWDNGLQIHDLCEEPTELCITATDACSGSNANVEYLLFLDLDGNGSMETVINSVNTGIAGLGWNNVLYDNLSTPNFAGGTPRAFDGRPVPNNMKYGFAIQETVAGMNKTACVRWNTQQQQNTYVIPELPHGTHKIKWFITDGCGNNKEYEYTFTVKDCKAPTVVCLNGLSVNIMPTAMIQLWASDFLQYTEDNCTPNPLKIGIRKCGTGTGFPVDAQGNPILQVTFDCTELGTQCVELWAIDAAGNADYCETYVIIQDNLGNCPTADKLNVTGVLRTETLDGVEEGTVSVTGTSSLAPPFTYSDLTDSTGLFGIVNSVPLASTFTIAPEKDDNPLNGVTTYDLVLVSKHILGLEPLNSPYKMIAADANKSGSITTFDIVEIRKLILGIYTELPNNTSWRFVDKAFVFPNVLNPFQTGFPEMVSVGNAMTSQWGKDFQGVKIGDVNNSAIANHLMEVEDRATATLFFDVQNRDVKAGETFALTFKASENIQAYQMTLNLNGLEVSEIIENDQISASNFGIFKGALTVSVNGANEFTVKFHATKSGRLSEMLRVSSQITKSEAYSIRNSDSGTQHELLDVALRFSASTGTITAGVGFELYQNQPNPFLNKTTIGFNLPAATAATLKVYDENGRTVFSQKRDFAKGYNTISLDRVLLHTNDAGMLYYTLETATDAATKKMILVKQ